MDDLGLRTSIRVPWILPFFSYADLCWLNTYRDFIVRFLSFNCVERYSDNFEIIEWKCLKLPHRSSQCADLEGKGQVPDPTPPPPFLSITCTCTPTPGNIFWSAHAPLLEKKSSPKSPCKIFRISTFILKHSLALAFDKECV